MHYDKQFPHLPDNTKNVNEQLIILKEEHEKLLQENQRLKGKLQSEQTLHSILYKQFQDLTNRQVTELKLNKRFSFIGRGSETSFKQVAIIVLSVFVLGMGFMIFNRKKNTKVLSSTTVENSISPKEQSVEQITSSNTKEVKNIKPNSTISLNTATVNEPLQPTSNFSKSYDIAQPKEASVNDAIDNRNNTPLYKVKAKAYFHNNPDNSTRRNAFIVHWNNVYATLKPLDEKNGFIYVVFTNHLGQTSKGWLNKNDLYSVNQK